MSRFIRALVLGIAWGMFVVSLDLEIPYNYLLAGGGGFFIAMLVSYLFPIKEVPSCDC